MSYSEDIISYLQSEGNIQVDITPDTTLFSTGLVDSFFMIEFILFLESSYNVQVLPEDITLDNLDSINKVLSYLKRKET